MRSILPNTFDPATMERQMVQSGTIHENTLIMRSALANHFSMKDLQDIDLLTLCGLYRDLVKEVE